MESNATSVHGGLAAEPGSQERELLSALADGELHDEEVVAALGLFERGDCQSSWGVYHLIGDVLRSPDLASPPDSAFLLRLREQLSHEPSPISSLKAEERPAIVADPKKDLASNSSIFRWKMVAGFASLAAVAAVGWSSLAAVQGPAIAGRQLADSAGSVSTGTPGSAVFVTAGNEGQQVMIRDHRLDELLAAHKQFGNTAALQMPAGFLRNATFESPSR